ncbi:MAG: hypothetical protein ACR2HP_12165 [Ilumatobacteraceae bacterium]
MTNGTLVATVPAVVLAHQGGWDEILLVVGPIAVVVGLLALARRRTRRGSRPTSGDSTPADVGAD